MTAKATGLDEDLLRGFNTLLTAFCCTKKLNPGRVEKLANRLLEKLQSLYPWKTLTPTVHKLLFHGSAFVREFNGYIGLYSEEAQEARNKDFKMYRRSFSKRLIESPVTWTSFGDL